MITWSRTICICSRFKTDIQISIFIHITVFCHNRKIYSIYIIDISSIHISGSLGVVKNIEFKIVAYLPRFFMLVFVKFYASIYRILLYSVL